jgi:hypothetical protein
MGLVFLDMVSCVLLEIGGRMCDVGFGVEMTVMVIYPAYLLPSLHPLLAVPINGPHEEGGRQMSR